MGCFFVPKNRKSEQETSGPIKPSNTLPDNSPTSLPDLSFVKSSKHLSAKRSFGRSRPKEVFRASASVKGHARQAPAASRISFSDPHLLPGPFDGSEAGEGFSGLLASISDAPGGFSRSNSRNKSDSLMKIRPFPLPVPVKATHPLPPPVCQCEVSLKACGSSPVVQNARQKPQSMPAKAFERSEPQPLPLPSEVVPASSLRSFSREEILAGCQNFLPIYLLRESEIGPVYLCSIKKAGSSNEKMAAAVTRISSLNFEAEDEVFSSIETLAEVQSPYVSRLLGVSMPKVLGWSRESFEWLLVSEYVESESLQNLLRQRDRSSLDWSARMKIALGTAKGLQYLHEKFQSEPCFDGYFDLSTIQIDKNFNPKLSDYSFHRLFNQNVSEVFDLSTDMSVLGKHGTEKVLVRNLGKVLLALITDRTYVDKIHFRDEEILQRLLSMLSDPVSLGTILDPALKGKQVTPCINKIVDLASQCLNDVPLRRPQLREVVEILQSTQDVKHDSNSRSSKCPIRKSLAPAGLAAMPNPPLPLIASAMIPAKQTYELPASVEHKPEEENKIWPQEQLPDVPKTPLQVISINAPAVTVSARGQTGKMIYRPLRKHVQMPNLTCSHSFLRHDLVRDMLQTSLSQTS